MSPFFFKLAGRRRLPEEPPGHKVDKLAAEDDLVPCLTKEVESLRKSSMVAQKKLHDVRAQLKDAKLRVRRTKRKLKLCKEKASSRKKEVTYLRAEHSVLRKSLDSLAESVDRLIHLTQTLRDEYMASLEDPLS